MNEITKIEKPEVGWGAIQFKSEDNKFSAFNQTTLDVLHWHGDKILIPKGSELIASSKDCKQQMFC